LTLDEHFQQYYKDLEEAHARLAEVHARIRDWLQMGGQRPISLEMLAELDALHRRRQRLSDELTQLEDAFLGELARRILLRPNPENPDAPA
jgi:hypothetical protein